jgi:membrane-associated phospholipid phosphatase
MAAKHDTTPYKGHVGLYRAGFIGALAVFVTTTMLALNGTATGWESTWFHKVNGWADHLETPMLVITALGSIWMVAATVVVAFFAQFYRLAWRLALSAMLAFGVVTIAKHVIDRARPDGLFAVVNERITEIGMGFPSGHATATTIIMLSLLPYLRGVWRWAVPVLISLVALSRLYLGVHVPLDVIGGVALGTIIVAGIRILPQHLRVLLRID